MSVPLPSGANGPHVLVESADLPVLDAHDRHHLEKSLRRRHGDPLTVTDGQGRWRPCRLTSEGIEATGDVVSVPRSEPTLTVGIALTKGGKPELTVQKLTELGVDTIALFAAARSVVKWDDAKAERQLLRLGRIAREALMQSRGVWLPRLQMGPAFADLAAVPGVGIADRAGDPLEAHHTTVLVGPEGGWTDDERALVTTRVRLGPNVLRAETAGIAAGVLMTALRDRTGLAPDR